MAEESAASRELQGYNKSDEQIHLNKREIQKCEPLLSFPFTSLSTDSILLRSVLAATSVEEETLNSPKSNVNFRSTIRLSPK